MTFLCSSSDISSNRIGDTQTSNHKKNQIDKNNSDDHWLLVLYKVRNKQLEGEKIALNTLQTTGSADRQTEHFGFLFITTNSYHSSGSLSVDLYG